jgi:hypothetical protein
MTQKCRLARLAKAVTPPQFVVAAIELVLKLSAG